MKKIIYALILPMVVASGLVYADREIKNETSKHPPTSHSLLLKGMPN